VLLWLFRALVVVVLLLLLLLGLKQAVTGLLAPNPIVIGKPTPLPSKTGVAAFPTDEADALAMRFALAYETYDSRNPQSRQSALAPYLPSGADLTMGWNGQGQQTAELAVPTTVHVESSTQALVTVAVLTDGGQWIYIGVPVYAQGAEVVVTGTPALVPAPAKASYQAPTPGPGDGQLANQLQPNLSAFFTAYAASSQTDLSYYATPGVTFQGLQGQVQFKSLEIIHVDAQGTTRHAIVRVTWGYQNGAAMTQSYDLTLQLLNGQWHVGALAPAGI
jgi:hypothetical protein